MELKRLFLFVQLAAAAIVDYSYTNEAGMLKTSGSPETSDHTCVILRSTEWLAHALIGEAGKIGLQDGTKIFEHPEERRKDDNERHVIIPKPQSGSLAVSGSLVVDVHIIMQLTGPFLGRLSSVLS